MCRRILAAGGAEEEVQVELPEQFLEDLQEDEALQPGQLEQALTNCATDIC